MKKMTCVTLLALCAVASPIHAQTVETIPFRALLSSANENPPVPITATGTALVLLHVVRDASGQIVSASADFNVKYAFPGEITLTGMHIHRGDAVTNGPVRIDTGISAGNPVVDATGTAGITRQAQVLPTNAEGILAVKDMIDNPAGFYVNLHSTVNPGGVIRGQLQKAEMRVFLGNMITANENPPLASTNADFNATGLGVTTVIVTRGATGAYTSAQVLFDVSYTGFPANTSFTGLHIHQGPAGINGPVTLNSGVQGGANATPAAASGTGIISRDADINLTPAAIQTLDTLFSDPAGAYINIHTLVNGGGAMRAQMHGADAMSFQVTMVPSNETPPILDLAATGLGVVTVRTLRDATGAVSSALVTFDINYRFPAEATFVGLHIHDGLAGVQGGVTVNTGINAGSSVVSATGFGNIYRNVLVTGGAALATINSLIANPENHYVNLHTSANPGGAVRAQLIPANTAMPSTGFIGGAVGDLTLTTVAQGGLVAIYGANLTKVPTNLSGLTAGSLPTRLNGTSVTIGGVAAPLLTVDPGVLLAQVPLETPVGVQPVVVTNANGAGPAGSATVAATAPGLIVSGSTAAGNAAVVFYNADFGLVTTDRAARAGDLLLIYSTGLGQTTPALVTGRLAGSSPFQNTATATCTIGGQNAEVLYSIAAPGFVGLYQMVVRMPTGVAPGNAPLVIRVGGAASNAAVIPVR